MSIKLFSAVMMCVRLNEKPLIQEVLEGVPASDGKLILLFNRYIINNET